MTPHTLPTRLVTVGAIVMTLTLLASVGSAQVVELQPNLVPFPASELGIVFDSATGMTRLVFSTTSWNNGSGPLELRGGEVTATGQNVYQRVYYSDGRFYDRLVGTFVYHPEHSHFHFEGYALYTLNPVNAPGASQRYSAKTSFCVMDTTKVNGSLPGAPKQGVYVTCNPDVQGMSVGWGDKYGYVLAGQSIDLTGNPDADYDLLIEVDPFKRLLEASNADNTSCVRLHIGVSNRTVQVLGPCNSALATVSSIVPNSTRQGTSVSVTITGSGFAAGMSVGFENGSGPAPVATDVTVVDANTITATVSVKTGGPRKERYWDVRVGSAVLPRGFKVLP
jgi:hypothetical protein